MGDPASPPRPTLDFAASHALSERLIDGLETVIRGKRQALEYLVTCILAGGHILIEDVPGLGKTTLAKTVARLVSRSRKGSHVIFRRIQFTPDLLPYDITGVDVFDTQTADHFVKMIRAASLLGVQCMITGIKPQIAQTMTTIGVNLGGIVTLRNLEAGLLAAIKGLGYRVAKDA